MGRSRGAVTLSPRCEDGSLRSLPAGLVAFVVRRFQRLLRRRVTEGDVQVVEPAGPFLYNASQWSEWRGDWNFGLAAKRKERMGKGDRRSKRGKIFRGTFGKTRLKKVKKKGEQSETKGR